MDKTKQFTNEELAKKFKNNFMLVNYAISLAENMIQSGRDTRVRRNDLQNRAMLILEEIREGQDKFDDIIVKGGTASDTIPTVDYRRDARHPKQVITDSDFDDLEDEDDEDEEQDI